MIRRIDVASHSRPEIVDVIDALALPRYGLVTYLKPTLPADLASAEIKLLDDLSRAGKRLKGFCRTNFFKRRKAPRTPFFFPCIGTFSGTNSSSTHLRIHCGCPSGSKTPRSWTAAFVTKATANSTLMMSKRNSSVTPMGRVALPAGSGAHLPG